MTPLPRLSFLRILSFLAATLTCIVASDVLAAHDATKPQVSGVYPHLAYYNHQGECGTGAVVPWAERLWVITYGPHCPNGSDDKLYGISPELEKTAWPESIGGTPANRMIHLESNQLFIGPYVINDQGIVRTIPWQTMYGRLTGNARHLTDPANKIYCATMEEGFYEINVHTLAVRTLYADTHKAKQAKQEGIPLTGLPGYHGKGLYSVQGRLIYANNGERSPLVKTRPDIPSGCLAEWDGKDWHVVRRNQFTEVTGPGGIYGSKSPESDPVWSLGWDHRSVMLMVLDNGKWHMYRLPKASHCYDGSHGWNTEWPRIRDIGENDLLMTMHGMFWRFPKAFSAKNATGIRPRSTYLKVIGDFCRWGDRLVFGCDDSAKSEFLNVRPSKNPHAAPGQSHSNLWFTKPETLDQLGTPLGRGAVWLNDDVTKGETSDPYLFAGFQRRMLQMVHQSEKPLTVSIEIDQMGDGTWSPLRQVTLAPGVPAFFNFKANQPGEWIRLRSDSSAKGMTAYFQYSNKDARPTSNDPRFDALAKSQTRPTDYLGATLWSLGKDRGVLGLDAFNVQGEKLKRLGYYQLDKDLKLVKVDDPKTLQRVQKAAPPSTSEAYHVDAASIVFRDSLTGKHFRLPIATPLKKCPAGWRRLNREVVTERDLMNCGGTFYEYPADNAGGLAKIRPIATHGLDIYDYCSWRGLLVLSGIDATKLSENDPHVVTSDDGKCAVWLGVIDDLWKLGKPVGRGGPWRDTKVSADVPSDPYLMTGYDEKTLLLSHKSNHPVEMTVQVDLTGTGVWTEYQTFNVTPGKTLTYKFPKDFTAYWVRVLPKSDTTATAQFVYE